MPSNELTAKDKQEVGTGEQVRAGRYYVPETDIYEDDHVLMLRADVAGADPEKVSATLHEDVLTVEAGISAEDYRDLSPAHIEYNVGPFLRRFSLLRSAEFDRDRISAQLVDGVLEVTLPKAEKARPRRIPISPR